MAYCFAVLNGMPDCMPNSVSTYCVDTVEDARVILVDAIAAFCGDDYGHQAIDFHVENFGHPNLDASMWHWIMAFANEGSEELYLRGMTEAEYAADQTEEA